MGKEERWYGTALPAASQGPRNSPEENMRQGTATQAETKPSGIDRRLESAPPLRYTHAHARTLPSALPRPEPEVGPKLGGRSRSGPVSSRPRLF